MKNQNHKIRFLFLVFLSLFFFIEKITAQSTYYTLPSGLSVHTSTFKNEQIKKTYEPDKNYLIPAAEIVGLNFLVGAINTYVRDEEFAKISWMTIKDNFKTGFVWDEDNYMMNQFFHPYHGANYYNSARSNGLDFWESAPYTFGGSLMWEFFMENEPPSYNDLVNTSVSGITLGEISYRVSNLIIDESTTGIERFVREFSSTIINPMQGFNRLIKGSMWKTGERITKSDYKLLLSTGVHNLFLDGKFNNSISYLSLRADLIYGNKFSTSKNKEPFDYFSLRTEFNFAKGDDILGIFASGVLWDGKIKLFGNSNSIIGIYKEIDILSNIVYKLSAASFSGQVVNIHPVSNSISIESNLSAAFILMGGTNSKYAADEGKDYNLGPGASGNIGVKFIFNEFGEVYSNFKRYWIHTLAGADGNEFIGLLNSGINYNIFQNSILGLEFLLYERYGDYKKYENYSDSNTAFRIYFRHII